jgi:hypothetical protein
MATPAPADADAMRPPSKRWYRVASLIAFLGLAAAAAWWPYATTRQFDAVEQFVRTSYIGGTVAIRHAGVHTFWIEGDCLSCHDNNASEYRAVAKVSVVDPDGRPVRLRAPGSEWTFNTAKREGRALWVFDAPKPGPYKVRFDLDIDLTNKDWDNVPPQNLAFGEGVGLPVRIVRPMVVLGGGGIVLALGVAGVTATRRRRYYDRLYGRRGQLHP